MLIKKIIIKNSLTLSSIRRISYARTKYLPGGWCVVNLIGLLSFDKNMVVELWGEGER